MSARLSKFQRALAASPFLILAITCYRAMDIDKIIAHQLPHLEKGKIGWDGGSLPFKDFYHIKFLDDLWRGTTASFSPSTFGYDALSWWQMFTFLQDLGPLYAMWLLESYREGNQGTPAYFPTIFASAGQLLGIGPVASIFCFLCFVFAPRASHSVLGSPVRTPNAFILQSVLLLFHTLPAFGAFLSPTLEGKHYWTWAWQMAPLWVGVGNTFFNYLTKGAAPRIPPWVPLAAMSAISASTWIYTLRASPYTLWEIFIPEAAVQTEFEPHMRKALQLDSLFGFGSGYLWLVYAFYDLWAAGFVGKQWMVVGALIPVFAICVGPGAALAIGWVWRESVLQRVA